MDSLRISGNTDTSAIFKNPPAEKGKIQSEFALSASTALIQIATHAPVIPVAAVANCALAASYLKVNNKENFEIF